MELSPVLLICIFQTLGSFLFNDETIIYAKSLYNFTSIEEYKSTLAIFTNLQIVFLIIFILVADGLRYRLIIILGSISSLSAYLMAVFQPISSSVYVVLFFRAFSITSIKATLPYLLSIEDRSKYQKITAYVMASMTLGYSFKDVWVLFYLTHSSRFVERMPIYIHAIVLCILLPCSFILPPVNSERFRDPEETIENLLEDDTIAHVDTRNTKQRIPDRLRVEIILLWGNFKSAYTNCNVLKWSIYCSMVASMVPMVQLYGALLLNESPLFGSSDFYFFGSFYQILNWICYVITAILMILCSFTPTNWKTKGDLVLCSVSFIFSALTILLYFYLHQIFHIMIMNISRMLYSVFVTISVWEIAQLIPRNSYALVLGFNTFVAQIMVKILPTPDPTLEHLDIEEILIHAAIFVALGLWFGLSAKSIFGKKCSGG